MIKEVRISNYKSILEEQIFTMEACPKNEVSEHENHVVDLNGQRILKLASFYGPNGGGKSNLLEAINTFKMVILAIPGVFISPDNNNYLSSIFSKDSISTFDIFTINESFEIGYSLKVDLTKISEDINSNFPPFYKKIEPHIEYEELIYRRNKNEDFISLFNRDKQGQIHSNILGDMEIIKNNSQLSVQKTFISYLHETFGKAQSIRSDLGPIITFTNELEGITELKNNNRAFKYQEQVKKILEPNLPRIVKCLKNVDINITDLYFQSAFTDNTYVLYTKRVDLNGNERCLPLACESDGTKKLVYILLSVYNQTNFLPSAFLIDDFDAALHPKLVKSVIKLFASPNNKSHQLIFNSHDTINMNNEVFRRDEIWFAFKNEKNSSVFLPLSNIRNYKNEMVRKDAKYGKQYLEGRYGADPFIIAGMEWETEN